MEVQEVQEVQVEVQTHGGSSGSSGGSSDSRWKFELGSTECRVPLAREEDLKFKS